MRVNHKEINVKSKLKTEDLLNKTFSLEKI